MSYPDLMNSLRRHQTFKLKSLNHGSDEDTYVSSPSDQTESSLLCDK